jgi:hypothetical protein
MNVCEWWSLRSALAHFVTFTGSTQSQRHIKPLHWYVACRLVVEGGFDPDEIVPRPPFHVTRKAGRLALVHDPSLGGGGERTVYGGLKTKSVDVVVTKDGIGPVLAVSCKGAIGAFRNLTNRMEEAVGDCTNLHIAYPPLVCGYLFVMRANRAEEVGVNSDPAGLDPDGAGRPLAENDVAIRDDGQPVESVRRFHAALRELADRRGIRNDVSSYEAIAFALASTEPARAGAIIEEFPEPGGSLRFDRFFDSLYRQYDERFVYAAPDLRKVTARREWDAASPAFDGAGPTGLDYEPRTLP